MLSDFGDLFHDLDETFYNSDDLFDDLDEKSNNSNKNLNKTLEGLNEPFDDANKILDNLGGTFTNELGKTSSDLLDYLIDKSLDYLDETFYHSNNTLSTIIILKGGITKR